MKIILYAKEYERASSIDHFLTILHSSQMPFFASDLLQKGISLSEISEAIQRAMLAGKASGINVSAHFFPMYTQTESGLVKDCKLSRLGYAMVLMNARPDLSIVGEWQVRVLRKYFNEDI